MSKKKSLVINFNKLLLSVNTRIESFFNSIKFLFITKKKTKKGLINIDNKILLITGSVVTLVFIYFLIPTSYNKDLVKIKLTKQIFKKYNLEVSLDGNLKYGLFPKPHYYIKGTKIIHNEKKLANTDLLRIYISSKNFLSSENIQIKDLRFKKTEFNINYNNFKFFKEILNSLKSEHSIFFIDSKMFYEDQFKNVIFLTKIDNLNFSYTDELKQRLNAKLNIFNIPFKIKILNDFINKNTFINVESHKLRLNIQNNFDYSKENINGLLDFKVINKKKKINYVTNKETLSFYNSKNNLEGKIDFKPFYITTDLKLHQIDINKIFKDNSILLNLLNAEILNNQSLNAVLNINFERIKDIKHLNNIFLKVYFEEGNIVIKNSTLDWKNSITINLDDIQLISEDNKIMFAGTFIFDFKDINDFYKQYQIKKTYRKKIKKISLNFLLDINEKQIELDNVKIDGSSDKTINNFINNFNSQKPDIFNKIIFKNSIKEFFKDVYSG